MEQNPFALIERCSPYLTRLLSRYPAWREQWEHLGGEVALEQWRNALPPLSDLTSEAELMGVLRRHKAQGALYIALADISGLWSLTQVTTELTLLAERCLRYSLHFLWQRLIAAGHIAATAQPCDGLIVLGMGKLGGYELNYSSDIDLVLLYDDEKITYTGRQSLQHCLNRLSQDLVRLMQERTADGYVFRLDLRLRPDPGSTPPVVNRRAAMFYYETVGQNWERAAFIKARPVGGDVESGVAFLQELRPFIWRRSLDFAAIADIQSIKRQMDNRQLNELELPGHDLKRGLGGIREIEFIAQIHQLIWGGRIPALRLRGTCETLRQLAAHKLLDAGEMHTLIRHYESLRMAEHRLQMMEDQQTHTLPVDTKERERLAEFCGFEGSPPAHQLEPILREVHEIYRNCFNTEPSLAAGGSLSFTGVDLDANTLETLRGLGFQDAEYVAQTIANWHRGNVRAMRSPRARELLTELTPTLLKAFGETADPDHAFGHFNKFMERVPAVVQLFSLFMSNPEVLSTLAVIMGNAPALAAHLSRHPHWLDILLTAQTRDMLAQPLKPTDYLHHSEHEEDQLEALGRFRNEREFFIGTEILLGKLDPLEGNRLLSAAADAVITTTLAQVRKRFEASYGRIEGSSLAIIGLGRLGSNELCFGSDLDLIFVYDAPDDQALSDGEKSYPAVVYFNRLCQRFVGALEAATGEGRLYAVDTRLRPGGTDGPMAISREGFVKYFRESAWTFEKMALLRHRVIAACPLPLREKESDYISSLFTPSLPDATLKRDIVEMRERIAREYPPSNPWKVKHASGGLMEITFLAQYLALRYGDHHPTLLQADTAAILQEAARLGLLPAAETERLLDSWFFQSRLASLLRLCQRDFSEDTAPKGLLQFLANTLKVEDASALRETLLYHQRHAHAMFRQSIVD